jgi:tetratricopeptide (TPR) repeat protein
MYWDGSKANLEGAESASRKALEVDAELAEAHASRGFALSLNRQYDDARRELERAIAINPKLYEAYYFYARACMQEGKLEEAARHFADAARVRPEDYQALLLMVGPLRGLHRMEEAKATMLHGMQILERHLELNPDDSRALYLGGGALMQHGQREKALEWVTRARSANETDSMVLYNVACVYALGNMIDEALDCLDKAIQNGFGHREWLDNDSDLESLRGDARFQALRERL